MRKLGIGVELHIASPGVSLGKYHSEHGGRVPPPGLSHPAHITQLKAHVLARAPLTAALSSEPPVLPTSVLALTTPPAVG